MTSEATNLFEINPQQGDARQLTQAVIQIIQLLDMYNAELARVLHCQCDDIGKLANGRTLLQPDTEQWQNACRFVTFYQLLHRLKPGDGVAMRHWLRASNTDLDNTPHLLIVDEHRLDDIITYLKNKLAI